MKKKEAIQILETQYQHDSVIREALKTLIPEFRESEDERIRKGLIEVVSDIAGGLPFEEHKITKKEALAYLEKQKEYKPTSFNEPYNPDDYEVVMEGNATSLKRKEQKPAEKQDYSVLNDPERAILRGFLAAGIGNVPVGIIKETAKDCIAHFPWPTKWSKEDENTINELCNIIVSNSKNGYLGRHYAGDLVQKLKSLRPCPSWKPSEKQPDVDLEKEIDRWFGEQHMQNMVGLPNKPIVQIIARHFCEFGLNARKI